MKKVIIVIFLITLLPNELVQGNSAYMFVVKFFLVALLTAYLRVAKNVKTPRSIKNIGYFIIMMVIVAVGILRNNQPHVSFQSNIFRTFYFLTYFYTILSVYFFYSNKRDSFLNVLFLVVLMPSYLYYTINLILWAIKYPPLYDVLVHESLGDSVFLSLIGVHVQRVQFPLATGFNDYAVQIAITLSVTFAILLNKKINFNRFYLLGGVAVSLLSILLIDSRIAFVSVTVIPMSFLLLDKKIIKKLAFVGIIALFTGCFLMSAILPALSKSSMATDISRTNNDIVSGNSRLIVWGYINQELSEFKANQIIGYGEYGHYGSRVSLKWAKIFADYTDSELKSPHNTIYSVILDYGYIGLLFYLLLYMRMYKLLNMQTLQDSPIYPVILAFILVNSLNGVTETIYGFYCQNYIYIFLSIILIVFIASSSTTNTRIVILTTNDNSEI